MVNPLELASSERERMVSSVGVHEGDVDFVSEVLTADVVTQLQSEHRRIERFVLGLILRGDDDMPEPLVVGYEA